MTDPRLEDQMSDTLARLDGLREQMAPMAPQNEGEARQIAQVTADPIVIDLIIAEHNAVPAMAEMLVRAYRGLRKMERLILRWDAQGRSVCNDCSGFGATPRSVAHADDCAVTLAAAWLADYEGARDA